MRKTIITLLLCMAALSTSGCSCHRVESGYKGVIVHLLGSDKGEHEVVGVGRYYLSLWNEDIFYFPTFTQNYVWTADRNEGSPHDESISFQTREGLTVNADVGITFKVDPEKVDVLFQTYKKGIEEITDTFIRNHVRDGLVAEASKMDVEAVYGERKTALLDTVESQIRSELEPKGIIVEKLYWIGSIRLPVAVQNALDAKIEATQRAQQRENEVAEARAEAEKVIAEARGEADALLQKSRAITPMLLEYERIQVEKSRVEKWNGSVPTTYFGGEAGQSFLFNLDK